LPARLSFVDDRQPEARISTYSSTHARPKGREKGKTHLPPACPHRIYAQGQPSTAQPALIALCLLFSPGGVLLSASRCGSQICKVSAVICPRQREVLIRTRDWRRLLCRRWLVPDAWGGDVLRQISACDGKCMRLSVATRE